MKRSSTLIAVVACCSLLPSARANVKLPAIFSDHMLLQQDRAVPVWGWADVGEQVSVSLAGQTKATQAEPDGTWSVKLDKLAASGQPQILCFR
jgi:sialate O-acetylesterase